MFSIFTGRDTVSFHCLYCWYTGYYFESVTGMLTSAVVISEEARYIVDFSGRRSLFQPFSILSVAGILHSGVWL